MTTTDLPTSPLGFHQADVLYGSYKLTLSWPGSAMHEQDNQLAITCNDQPLCIAPTYFV